MFLRYKTALKYSFNVWYTYRYTRKYTLFGIERV